MAPFFEIPGSIYISLPNFPSASVEIDSLKMDWTKWNKRSGLMHVIANIEKQHKEMYSIDGIHHDNMSV